jgi:hypothetical protein
MGVRVLEKRRAPWRKSQAADARRGFRPADGNGGTGGHLTQNGNFNQPEMLPEWYSENKESTNGFTGSYSKNAEWRYGFKGMHSINYE